MSAQMHTSCDRDRLREYLAREAADGGFFFKSKFIADDVNLSASQVGVLVGQLQDRENDLQIEPWSYTNATTWYVEIEAE